VTTPAPTIAFTAQAAMAAPILTTQEIITILSPLKMASIVTSTPAPTSLTTKQSFKRAYAKDSVVGDNSFITYTSEEHPRKMSL